MSLSRRAVAGLCEHPAAGLLPGLAEGEFAALRQGIREHGILVPLEVTPEGMVLDGRHRLRLAIELGLAHVPVRLVRAGDPVEHMLLTTLQCRHLSQSQKACLAVELHYHHAEQELVATLPTGGRRRDRLAQITGVCPRLIQDALTLYIADRRLFRLVKEGGLPLHRARQELKRRERYAQIGDAPPLPTGLFEVILADPPWQMGNPSAAWAPEQHYPTLPLDQIKQLAVPAAADALLFLWVPASLIPQGLEVIEAWGFIFRTEIVWDKLTIGPGQWLRMQHEPLLLASRGHASPPPPQQRVSSVIQGRRRGHSSKPDAAYELIERMYPQARKLELYARGTPRPGWSAWGNQVDTAEQAA